MKILLVVLGCISCVLGIVGIFVPLLPTTPFLLLSAALWVRSSPRLYGWLLAHPCFGEYVRNFRENRAIPLRAKIISLTSCGDAMLYCIFCAAYRLVVGAGGPACRRHWRDVAYPFVRHPEKGGAVQEDPEGE